MPTLMANENAHTNVASYAIYSEDLCLWYCRSVVLHHLHQLLHIFQNNNTKLVLNNLWLKWVGGILFPIKEKLQGGFGWYGYGLTNVFDLVFDRLGPASCYYKGRLFLVLRKYYLMELVMAKLSFRNETQYFPDVSLYYIIALSMEIKMQRLTTS